MKLVQSILTKNDCYKSGRKITVKGLMLHSVGCSQPNASVFVKNWNRSGLEACVPVSYTHLVPVRRLMKPTNTPMLARKPSRFTML